MSRRQHGGVTEQAKASLHRLEDARVLLVNGRWRGAMYLGGYSVECLLKAKLMQRYGCQTLASLQDELYRRNELSENASVWTHSIEVLFRLADGMDRCKATPSMWRDFLVANRWTPAWRCDSNLSNSEDASGFLEAAERLRRWVEHNI